MKVIIIAAHGWHAGWLGCYGNEWISTPHLDRLASEGAVFDQHFADSPSIEGAIHSWKTGRYHSPSGPDLFQFLSENGIACVAIRDVCVKDRPTVTHDWDILIETDEDIDLCSGVETFLEGIDPAVPALLWAETDQLLPPWVIDPELYAEYEGSGDPWPDPPLGPFGKEISEWERLRHSYAAVVAAFDEQLGAIYESIKTHPTNDPILLIVTAGWGYPLGEHGFVGPGLPQLYEECVHIPLIMRFPESAHAGRRIAAFSQNVDLLPSVLDAFSLTTPTSIEGRGLLPLVTRAAMAIRPYAFAHQDSSSAIRTPEWALLRSASLGSEPVVQLFRKPHDRWEVNDLRQHHSAWADYLERTLKGLESATQTTGPMEFPALRDYTDIVNEGSSPQEPTDEHRSTGGGEHDESKSQGDLRRHQSDEEN